MCNKCVDPESPDGRKVREFLASIGKNYSEESIRSKTSKLKNLDDLWLATNALFDPDTDSMPDGVHAKPLRMWFKVVTNRRAERMMNDVKAERHARKLLNQYRQLKIDPKPEFFEWAASQLKTRFMLFESMLRTAVAGKTHTDQTKASSGMLEYSKVKPKQTIEVSQAIPQGELADLFRQFSQLATIPPEAVETFISTYIVKPN